MIHSEKAFAKINLFLDVLSKRIDGYHDIGTLFQTVDAHDLLSAQELSEDRVVLRYSAPQDYPVESDLVYRAAMAIREKAGIKKGVELMLEKRLPLGAGLGGGSADAAAALRLLNRMWALGLSSRELCELGVTLGADVPFLVDGGTAFATGIGDVLEPLAPAKLPSGGVLAIATPLCAVPTKAAYAGIRPSGSDRWEQFRKRVLEKKSILLDEKFELFNKFEESVFPQYPQISQLCGRFRDSGAVCTMMSGSGASVFALFSCENDAKRALEAINSEIRWGTVAQFLQHC